MPELPEVETIRRDLAATVLGRRIEDASALTVARLRNRPSPDALVQGLQGRAIAAVRRRGKWLLLDLGDRRHPVLLAVHLGMSGQLRWVEDPDGEPPRPHTHLTLRLDDGAELRLVDPRTFGQVAVGPRRQLRSSLPGLADLGPEPLSGRFTTATLSALLARHTARLKPVLMNQRFVAGLGNLYTDEILHRAGLRADRASADLGDEEVARLHRSMVGVLRQAVRCRGSSLGDLQYRDLFGRVGSFQERHAVYGREGLPCRRCGSAIERARLAGRSNFSCPRCQR